MTIKPNIERVALQDLIKKSVKAYEALPSEEKEKMHQAQKESWVRGQIGWPKSKYRWENGVKVYASYEDYCND
jgi:hypothetical protein